MGDMAKYIELDFDKQESDKFDFFLGRIKYTQKALIIYFYKK